MRSADHPEAEGMPPRARAAGWRALAVAFAALLLFAAGGPSAIAENEPDILLRNPASRVVKPPARKARPAARPEITRPTARRPVHREPAESPSVAARRASPYPGLTETRPAEATFFVAVIGADLGARLAQGLVEALSDKPDIGVLRKFKESSGLVRDDFYDWPKAANALLASGERIDIAVMIVGTNDRQPLRDAEGAQEPLSPRWRAAYGQRVEAISAAFRARGTPLVWLGLPIMRGERFAADMQAINAIARERAMKAGATFIDVWDKFADDSGQFTFYGPDVSGQTMRLRAADGVNLTRAGGRKLAFFVEGEIRDAYGRSAPAAPAVETATAPPAAGKPRAAPDDPDALPDATAIIRMALRREAAAAAGISGLEPIAEPAPLTLIPVRPEAGPTAALNAPILSPDGALARRGAGPVGQSEAQIVVRRALVRGLPQDARPGRADDFAWPRR